MMMTAIYDCDLLMMVNATAAELVMYVQSFARIMMIAVLT